MPAAWTDWRSMRVCSLCMHACAWRFAVFAVRLAAASQAGDRCALLSAAMQVSQLSGMLPAHVASDPLTLAMLQAKADDVVNALLDTTSVDDPKQVSVHTCPVRSQLAVQFWKSADR